MSGSRTATVEAVARVLAAHNVAAWSPKGSYPKGTTGIFVAVFPQAPDLAVSLTAYPLIDAISRDERDAGLTVMGLQVKVRGTTDPRTADDLADKVYEVLHGLTDLVAGAGIVLLSARVSSIPLGVDENDRWVVSDNYQLTMSQL